MSFYIWLLIGIFSLIGLRGPTSEPAPPALPRQIIGAGQAADITIGFVDMPEDYPVTLIGFGSAGVMIKQANIVQQQASFSFSPADTRYAGHIQAQIWVGDKVWELPIHITPLPDVQTLLPVVVPRSIVAGGADYSLLTVLATDALGNPMANDTPLQVLAHYPNVITPTEATTITIQNQLAWLRLPSQNNAGSLRLGVQAINPSGSVAYGPERLVRVVPRKAKDFRLSTSSQVLLADGYSLIEILSNPLLDMYDNVLLDGTSGQAVVIEADGTRRMIPFQVREGRAKFSLQTPASAGSLSVQAFIGEAQSEQLNLTFAPALAMAPFTIATQFTANDYQLQVTIAPLLSYLGQFVPDGTPVRLWVTQPNGTQNEYIVPAEQGQAVLNIRSSTLSPGQYQFRAKLGGREVESQFVLTR